MKTLRFPPYETVWYIVHGQLDFMFDLKLRDALIHDDRIEFITLQLIEEYEFLNQNPRS